MKQHYYEKKVRELEDILKTFKECKFNTDHEINIKLKQSALIRAQIKLDFVRNYNQANKVDGNFVECNGNNGSIFYLHWTDSGPNSCNSLFVAEDALEDEDDYKRGKTLTSYINCPYCGGSTAYHSLNVHSLKPYETYKNRTGIIHRNGVAYGPDNPMTSSGDIHKCGCGKECSCCCGK